MSILSAIEDMSCKCKLPSTEHGGDPSQGPTHCNFVQVSIVAFKKGQLQVLSHAWDRNLGGRDFDEVLFEHFVKEFDAKHKLDIKSNARASFRLRLACEKVCPKLLPFLQTDVSAEHGRLVSSRLSCCHASNMAP